MVVERVFAGWDDSSVLFDLSVSERMSSSRGRDLALLWRSEGNKSTCVIERDVIVDGFTHNDLEEADDDEGRGPALPQTSTALYIPAGAMVTETCQKMVDNVNQRCLPR